MEVPLVIARRVAGSQNRKTIWLNPMTGKRGVQRAVDDETRATRTGKGGISLTLQAPGVGPLRLTDSESDILI